MQKLEITAPTEDHQSITLEFPFRIPPNSELEKSVMGIVEPILLRPNRGSCLQLQPTGDTQEEALEDLRRLVTGC